MKFADKGTVVRTVLLLLALLNQTLLMFGKSPLNIQEDQVSQLADMLYAAGSAVFTKTIMLQQKGKNSRLY